MRRALASLLVLVLTLSLVVRGVAAPLMHLQPNVPAPAPASVAHPEHDHADCSEAEVADGAASGDSLAAHAHQGRAKHAGARFDHGKVCDSNGACCGPLVLSESSDGLFGLVPLPEPSQISVSPGIKPLSPDRPPSSSIA